MDLRHADVNIRKGGRGDLYVFWPTIIASS
jgi:hypothetical protein